MSLAGIFQGIESDSVAAIAELLLPAEFFPEQTIFAEGQPGDRLYVIDSPAAGGYGSRTRPY
ncbi:MAG TPA: hypothetical protein VFK56_17370 [Mycobacterium sp.]|nr:hypothetical protein [Mycobacterium sp.]